MKIESDYTIDSDTLAILPAKQLDYDSIVITKNSVLYIRQTPLEIIKASCIEYWTTYEGRRRAVAHHMKYQQKVPIPVSVTKQLFFFPTHSPTSIHNNWIAAQHIAHIDYTSKQKATIQFTCGETITLNTSLHKLYVQINRTRACMYQMGEMKDLHSAEQLAKIDETCNLIINNIKDHISKIKTNKQHLEE